MSYNVGSDSDELVYEPLFLQGSGVCAMSTGQLDQRLVRGGTSTPNVFVQDGVQPLFEFAAAPFSDRSFSSGDGPVSFSSEVEPLLEFAERHVPLQDRLRPFFDPGLDTTLYLLLLLQSVLLQTVVNRCWSLLQCMGLHRIAAALFDPGQETTL